MKKLDRRTFIKQGATATAALGLMTNQLIAAPNSNVNKVERLRLGVIGAGGKGWGDWRPMMTHGSDIVAICDTDRDVIEKSLAVVKERRGDEAAAKVQTFTDYRKLLDNIKKLGINGVTVSTPDHHHGPVAIAAMQQGCHAFVQKPLVRTIAEAHWFARAARENKVVTQMGAQGGVTNGFRRNVEVLQSGVLGDVTEVHVWTDRPSSWPQGVPRPEGSDPVPGNLDWDSWIGTAPVRSFKAGTYHPGKWRGFYDFGTGAFGDMACHEINLPFRGLFLGKVDSAECVSVEGISDDLYPAKSIVKVSYAPRTAGGREWVKTDLFWYDGKLMPPTDLMPEVINTIEKLPKNGALIIGSKGIIFISDPRGCEAYICLKGEQKIKSVLKHEATSEEVIPVTIPRLRSADIQQEFVAACYGRLNTYTDADVSVPMMEGILIGCIAQRIPNTKLNWDCAKLSFGRADADAFITPFIRPGWNGWEYK